MEESNLPLEEFEPLSPENGAEPAQTDGVPENKRCKKRTSRYITALSFGAPFLLASLAFVLSMLFTDGTNMLLSSDGWHQYYPFLVTLREKLLSGGSPEYSWVVGMGGNFVSLFAYYLASPMYLLSVLVPLEALPHYFTLMTVAKLTLAGGFFARFLRLVYQREDFSQVFFGLLYAFCAWSAGYYWNIMWLDTFALLPLLIAGTVSLLRDGRFRLYTLVLALSLWCNYYVAFFCCIFVFLCFVGYCICCPNGWKNFLRRFLRIGLCTLLGAGIACVLLIPTLLAMQTTYSATGKEFALLQLNIVKDAYGTVSTHGSFWQMLVKETLPGIFEAGRQVLTGLMPASDPTSLEGTLPNVFCGFSTVILSLYYFCCRKIRLREKLVNLALLAILMLSFIVRWLDYVWHGFHFTNMLPFRFSFLFSFVLIAMAYRAFTLLDDFEPRYLIFIVPMSALLIYNAWGAESFGSLGKLLALLVLIAVSVFFLLHYFSRRAKKPQRKFAAFFWKRRQQLICLMLFFIFAAEATMSLASGININGFTSQYNADGEIVYPRKNANVRALLSYLDQKTDDPLFYRTEVTGTQTLNDAALNGYNGVSVFNSSANANFNRLTRSLGLASWVGSNRYVYYDSSPFTNMMCGIRYLIDRSGKYLQSDYNDSIAQSGSVTLLQNNAFISVGFMTDSALGDFFVEENRYNPIVEQEEMFRAATGIEDALYEHVSADNFTKPFAASIRLTGTSGTQYTYSVPDACTVSLVYTIEEDGLYIATTKRPTKAEKKITVYRNGKSLFQIDTNVRMIFSVGNLEKGDKLTFTYTFEEACDGNISLDVARQNDDVFDAGLMTLSDEPFVVSECSDGYLRGTVEAKTDGLFYTSVPYEPGWRAYVDGREVELAPGYDAQNSEIVLADAVVCFPLTEGTHEIELVYTAPGLYSGLAISIVSILIFLVVCFLVRKNPVLLADKPFAPERKRTLCASVAAVPAVYLAVDLLMVIVRGAKAGYQAFFAEKPPFLFARLPGLEKLREDEIFVFLSLLALVIVPTALWLVSCPLREAWYLLRQARTKRTGWEEAMEELEREDICGEENTAQSDSATQADADADTDLPCL